MAEVFHEDRLPMNRSNENLIEDDESTTEEKDYRSRDGCCMLFSLLLIILIFLIATIVLPIIGLAILLVITIPILIISFICLFGLFTLQPNEASVLLFLGAYKGTTKQSGFHWVNPLFKRVSISLRSNNLNGEQIKVNDKSGNPIIIAAVVVWRVKNTAKAIFDVNSYSHFVSVQYESAVRNLAMSYPYESRNENEISLRSGQDIVTNHLINEMEKRLVRAGIDVEEARITTLSYSSEIAGAMLRRQQAEAVVAAREKIVQGAIGIIKEAVTNLRDNNIVILNQEEKSKLICNLLIVLCSEQCVQPILNTGA